MRINRIQIVNFKLLEDVSLDLSTDLARPLTAIRAENGSGKTSLLHAMLWGFYGRPGLPKFATDMRLSSTAKPFGVPVKTRVMVEFEHDGDGGRGHYRLIRSSDETPVDADTVKRGGESLAVYEINDTGEAAVAGPDAFLRRVVPGNLREVFFTNGDDVQEFMSGRVDRTDRQDRVHQAIKALLGLDQFYLARKDLTSADRKFRKELSQDGGADLIAANAAVEAAETARDQQVADIDRLVGEASRIKERRDQWEQALREITDIGDLNKLNAELAIVEDQLQQLEADLDLALKTIREELSSQRLSWGMIHDALAQGMKTLEDLSDRGIIPGTSIEVIRDRLDEGVCFCGTDLGAGSDARTRLEHILAEHRNIDPMKELLTAAHHGARLLKAEHDADVANSNDFAPRRKEHLARVTTVQDGIRTQRQRHDDLIERRKKIDESRVTQLTSDIQRADTEALKRDRELAILRHDLDGLERQLAEANDHHSKIQKQVSLSDVRQANANAVADLKQLVDWVIHDLEVEHVHRVASLMSQRFLDIVGSDPTIDAAIFGSVTINADFDIEVRTPQGTRLDFDAEINGASQRALTLSFIWALMEVADVEAPRIIDTPLGMVAGAVKTRLTDAITSPPPAGGPAYQVVLLLTRSEIRDVEDLIDERAGIIRTMSCSKDSKDLRFPWGQERPHVRVCTCTHRQSCRVCARTYDDDQLIQFRDIEAVAP